MSKVGYYTYNYGFWGDKKRTIKVEVLAKHNFSYIVRPLDNPLAEPQQVSCFSVVVEDEE